MVVTIVPFGTAILADYITRAGEQRMAILLYNGGRDPRLLGLTMGRLLDRTFGERPRASRIVQTLGLDLDYIIPSLSSLSSTSYVLDRTILLAPHSSEPASCRSGVILGQHFPEI